MAAGGVRLDLQVGLDLAYLRSQLSGLGTLAQTYSLPIKAELDTTQLQKQLRAASKGIRLNINDTSVIAAINNTESLIKQLNRLSKVASSVTATTGAAAGAAASAGPSRTFRQVISDLDIGQLRSIAKAAAEDGIIKPFEESVLKDKGKLLTALNKAANNAGQGFINGLENQQSALAKAAGDYGNALITGIKKTLKMASPSKKMEELGENSGEGFEKGLQSGIQEAVRVGVKEIRDLYRALQGEARSGTASLQAILMGAMAGVVQLPGGRQQRQRLQTTGGVINQVMGGTRIPNIVARQSVIRGQAANASAVTPSFLSALPLMLGMNRTELGARLGGIYGQQYRAPAIRGNAGIGRGLGSQFPVSGMATKGIFEFASKSFKNASASFLNAIKEEYRDIKFTVQDDINKAKNFMSNLQTRMTGPTRAFSGGSVGIGGGSFVPTSGIFGGGSGIGAGTGSFVPMSGRSLSQPEKQLREQFRNLLDGLAKLKKGAKATGNQIKTSLIPSFADLRTQATNATRRRATAYGAQGGIMGGAYVNKYGRMSFSNVMFPTSGMAGTPGRGSMGRFPMSGMMYPPGGGGGGGGNPPNRPPSGVRGGIGIGGGSFVPTSGIFGGGGGTGAGTGSFIPFGGGGGGGNPPNRPPGGGGGGNPPNRPPSGVIGGGSFGGGLPQSISFPSLPGRGAVRELADEFKFATQQILLFGQAYKLLGFIQDLPTQVGNAVGKLQSFNNTIKQITPSAQEASASSEFILNVVERYNVPLDSARDGFTKLYASMAPAGFNGDEIRNLFLGISKAAATFGMSADKVDRVTYAFAQMASKGQVMSEELKGQLGDVLPGAMAIFAKAAGFKGPDAIQKFSKALEDGAYKASAARQLISNVGVALNREFGPGAEGAARTYQGVINRIQNSTKLFYESLEPLAVGFANSVIVPVSQGLRNLAEGIKSFTTGQKAASEGGQAVAASLKEMAPVISGLISNIKLIAGNLVQLGQGFGVIVRTIATILSLPLVGYVASTYAQVMLLYGAFVLLNGQALIPLIRNIGLFLATLPGVARYQLAMLGLAGATQQSTMAMNQFGTMVQSVMIRTVIGVALVAIGALIARIVELRGQMAAISGSAKQMGEAARISAKFGDVVGTKEAVSNIKNQLDTYKQLRKEIDSSKRTAGGGSPFSDRGAISEGIEISTSTAQKLLELGVLNQTVLKKTASGYKVLDGTLGEVNGKIDQQIKALTTELPKAEKQIRIAEQNKAKQKTVTEQQITGIGEDEKTKNQKLKESSELNRLAQQEVEIQAELGVIGKDALSKLDAKVAAAKEILKLTLQDIRATKTGEIQTKAIAVATLEYQKLVKQANEDWQETLKNVNRIKSEADELRLKIQGQETPDKTPLENALQEIEQQAIANIQQIDELLSKLNELAGIRPEAGAARKALGGLRAAIEEQTPEQKRLRASKDITKDVFRDLKTQLAELKNAGKNVKTIDEIILKLGEDWASLSPQIKSDLMALAEQVDTAKPFAEMAQAIKNVRDELKALVSTQGLVVFGAEAIGSSFAQSFKDTISGAQTAQQALSSFFQRIADSFLDMAAQMIQKWIQMQMLGLVQSLLTPVAGGFTGAFGASGPSFNSSIFSGSALSPGAAFGAAGAPNLSGAFGGVSNASTAFSGIKLFADGGVVTGPTLGLVGEGRFNEAVVPLPDGKTIPVDLGGAGNNISTNIVINVNNGQAQSNTSGGASDLGRKMEGAVKQVIVNEMRPGGLLSGGRR